MSLIVQKLWRVSFIRGNIKDKRFRKKGFTLIELLIALSIVGIIISSQILILFKYMKTHRQEINQSRDSFYVNEAFMIIENQISSAKYVSVENNIITLKSYERSGYDYIRKYGSSNTKIVISDGLVHSSYSNNILEDIKDFKAEQVNQLIYISIETKEGNKYKRCLGLERIKIKDTP